MLYEFICLYKTIYNVHSLSLIFFWSRVRSAWSEARCLLRNAEVVEQFSEERMVRCCSLLVEKYTSNGYNFLCTVAATLARRPVAGEWQAEALHNGRQDSLDEMMRWTKLFKYVHFCIKWRFRRRFQWGFCHLGAQRWHLRRDMVTFRAVNSCQRRWHSESLGGSDQLWEFLNVFHVVVTASHAVLELYAPQLFQKKQEFRRGGKLKQISTKNNKKISQWGDLLSPRIRAPILCIFYGKISSPQLKFLSRFFSGKLFRLRFSGEALNGFVFLCWISQCRSYHTFVQSIFAACAVSWLQYLAIHSIWNKYWRSWS